MSVQFGILGGTPHWCLLEKVKDRPSVLKPLPCMVGDSWG